jgi:prepilin-type processing-associated H-X9-DG protein
LRIAYPPEQRTSFLADLLPYIGRGGLRAQIQDRKYPWYAKENLPAAETWVAEFLIPTYPPTTWRATHPLVADGRPVGATNYVGLAGVGLDAARFDSADPEQAKKAGITGYDWGSTEADIKDGLSNTAYLIQAPPGMARPWIAGGGATLVGVDDTDDALKPFLYPGAGGQRGATVLMADGSVRFVKEGTAPAVFKAIVTRAGGESLTDLDNVAPKVKQGRDHDIRGTAQRGP